MAKQIHACSYCRAKNNVDPNRLAQAVCGVCGLPIAATYYDMLEVGKEASDQDIKRAYRRLALKWHPDGNKTSYAEAVFKSINEAYTVLRSPDERRRYDDSLAHVRETAAGWAEAGPFDDGASAYGFAAAEDAAGPGASSYSTHTSYGRPHTDERRTTGTFMDEMYNLGLRMAFQNMTAAQIQPELIRRRCPPDAAATIATRCVAERKSAVRRFAGRSFTLGVAGFVFGLMFVGFWGGVLFGGLGMARAAYRLITGKVPRGSTPSSIRRHTIF